MDVEIIDKTDSASDAFVQRMPDGRICYLSAWSDMIARALGHRAFYLAACNNGRLCGVLPLMQVRSRLFGNHMISQAFSNYGGPLAESEQARDALFNRAVEIAAELNCESIELRNIKPLPYDLYLREDKLTMLISLEGGAEQVWHNVKGEIRKQTRKAEKNGLVASDGSVELLDDFYTIYSRRMHELGTPAYPKKLMLEMLRTFPQNVRLFAVNLKNVCVSAGLVTCFNGIAEVPWSATSGKYNLLYPNRLLYWTMIEHYCKQGARFFDFGRSSIGGGNYEFKRRWRAEPVRLHYQYWVRPGRELSILSPDNPKYKRRVQIWKKLPFWVTRLLGPYISRNLP